MNGGPRRIRRTVSLLIENLRKSFTGSIRIAHCCFEVGDRLRLLRLTRSRIPFWMIRQIYLRQSEYTDLRVFGCPLLFRESRFNGSDPLFVRDFSFRSTRLSLLERRPVGFPGICGTAESH